MLDRSLIAWKDCSHGTASLDYDEGNAADAAESEDVCDDLSVRLVCSVASELDHYVNGSAEAIAADMDDMMVRTLFSRRLMCLVPLLVSDEDQEMAAALSL